MYNRILLKLSGEALKGETTYGIDPETVSEIADTIGSYMTVCNNLVLIFLVLLVHFR